AKARTRREVPGAEAFGGRRNRRLWDGRRERRRRAPRTGLGERGAGGARGARVPESPQERGVACLRTGAQRAALQSPRVHVLRRERTRDPAPADRARGEGGRAVGLRAAAEPERAADPLERPGGGPA